MSDELPYCEAELRRARKRIAKLEAALGYIAKVKTWRTDDDEPQRIARKALEK